MNIISILYVLLMIFNIPVNLNVLYFLLNVFINIFLLKTLHLIVHVSRHNKL